MMYQRNLELAIRGLEGLLLDLKDLKSVNIDLISITTLERILHNWNVTSDYLTASFNDLDVKQQGHDVVWHSGWIPFEECPPNEGDECLVIRNGKPDIDVFCKKHFVFDWLCGKPTHWMPLPEPPLKGE